MVDKHDNSAYRANRAYFQGPVGLFDNLEGNGADSESQSEASDVSSLQCINDSKGPFMSHMWWNLFTREDQSLTSIQASWRRNMGRTEGITDLSKDTKTRLLVELKRSAKRIDELTTKDWIPFSDCLMKRLGLTSRDDLSKMLQECSVDELIEFHGPTSSSTLVIDSARRKEMPERIEYKLTKDGLARVERKEKWLKPSDSAPC